MDVLISNWQPTGEETVDAGNDTQQEVNALNNNSTLDEATNDTLWNLKAQPQTEVDANNIVEPNIEAIVNFPSELKLKPVYLAVHTGEDDEMDLKWLTVPKGQMTFDSEGDDIEGDINFTRLVHLPLQGIASTSEIVAAASGITIGRGLDVGQRTAEQVQALFDKVAENCRSIDPTLLDFLKVSAERQGAKNKTGKKLTGAVKEAHIARAKAQDKALIEHYKNFKNSITDKNKITLTRKQQHYLFMAIYSLYEKRTKNSLTRQAVVDKFEEYGKLDYDALPDNVIDILVDMTYRGDNRTVTREWIMKALIEDQKTNDFGESSNFYLVLKKPEWFSDYGLDDNRSAQRKKHLK